MSSIFCGPYEIKKANVTKSYAILDDNSIEVRTFKDGNQTKARKLPQSDLQVAIDELDNIHYVKVTKKGYKPDGNLASNSNVLGKRANPNASPAPVQKEPTKVAKTNAKQTAKSAIKGKKAAIPSSIVAGGSGHVPLMLAETIEKVSQDPTGWLMSEKLDGVRCYWNGTNMYTRTGKDFNPPQWFKDALPKNLALDGELFTKRDDF